MRIYALGIGRETDTRGGVFG
ncbi:conserved hypothetical protein [Hyphomicrobium sp. GJ21]|nr:conserved hypothetical protein [Hyphomicrobium sp. GJ21]